MVYRIGSQRKHSNEWRPVTYIAFISFLLCLSMAGSQLLLVVKESIAAINRNQAYEQGQQTEADLVDIDCITYFTPGNDVPSSPGGIFFASFHHVINAIFMLLCAIEEFPRKGTIGKLTPWCVAFGVDAGAWYCGALQIIVAFSVLGRPVGVFGPQIKWYLFIDAWLLVAIGVINLIFGMTMREEIRWRRHQFGKPEVKLRARDKWLWYRGIITTTYAEHLQVGALQDALAGMDACITKMLLLGWG